MWLVKKKPDPNKYKVPMYQEISAQPSITFVIQDGSMTSWHSNPIPTKIHLLCRQCLQTSLFLLVLQWWFGVIRTLYQLPCCKKKYFPWLIGLCWGFAVVKWSLGSFTFFHVILEFHSSYTKDEENPKMFGGKDDNLTLAGEGVGEEKYNMSGISKPCCISQPSYLNQLQWQA